jgi:hypothetical protein
MRALLALSLAFAACSADNPYAGNVGDGGGAGSDLAGAGCQKDTDCKGDRICVAGSCASPGAVDLATSTHDLAAPPADDLAATAPDLAVQQDLTAMQQDLAATQQDLALAPHPDLAPVGDLARQGACAGPGDCGGNPCCMTLKAQAVQSVQCGGAPSDCAPAIDFAGSGQTRLCTRDADCTSGVANPTLPSCCTAMQGGQHTHLCFSRLWAPLTMGQITCP